MASRVLPIRTSDRIMYELTPASEEAYEWTPTRTAGDHIIATVRPLSRIEVQEVSAIEEPRERIARIVELGLVSLAFEGDKLTSDELPYLHWQSLGGVIFGLSVTGADPFGRAPAASPR